jgi:hypothetical protein
MLPVLCFYLCCFRHVLLLPCHVVLLPPCHVVWYYFSLAMWCYFSIAMCKPAACCTALIRVAAA